jgi:hypothetical protein
VSARWPYDGDYVRIRHGRTTHIAMEPHHRDGWVQMSCSRWYPPRKLVVGDDIGERPERACRRCQEAM